jgi:hypothetical protein
MLVFLYVRVSRPRNVGYISRKYGVNGKQNIVIKTVGRIWIKSNGLIRGNQIRITVV